MINMIRKQIPKLVAQDIVGVQLVPMSAGAIFAPYRPESLKYKFSRAKWYVAEFDDQYYFEVEEWCAEQFGPHPRHPDAWCRWHHTYHNQIHFRDEDDYLMFILRWGA
jgi:hypothetical protein